MRRFLLLFACLLTFVTGAFAHEVRPAYLELRQTAPDTYDVLWKVPGLGDNMRLGIYVTLPEGSINLSEPSGVFVNSAFIERWTVKRSGGLTGETILIDGLGATATDVLLRVERQDGSTQLTRLTPSAPSFVVEATPSKMEVVRSYLALGVEHILGGIDHLLFVLALFSFNVGVEIGQLLFIAAVFAVLAVARQVLRRVEIPRPVWAWRVAPYAIGSVSAFWLIQRVAAF